MRKYEHLQLNCFYNLLIEGSENTRKKTSDGYHCEKCTICCLKIRAYLVVFQTKRDIKISQAPSNDEKLAGVLFRVRGDHIQFFLL